MSLLASNLDCHVFLFWVLLVILEILVCASHGVISMVLLGNGVKIINIVTLYLEKDA
jgi:hypothetical protein